MQLDETEPTKLNVKRLMHALVNVEENHLNLDCIADECDHADGEHPEYAIGCGDAEEIAAEYDSLTARGED